jgi:hypothetical protein
MSLPESRRFAATVLSILIAGGAILVLPAPQGRADVVMVPVVFIENNTLVADLVVDGGIVRANVTRQFELNETMVLDELFEAGIIAPGATSLSAKIGEPGNASLAATSQGFNITFNSTESGKSRLLVRYTYSIQFAGVGALNFSIIPKSADEVHPMWTVIFMEISDFTLRVHSNTPVSIFNGSDYHNGTDVEVSEWGRASQHWYFYPARGAAFPIAWSAGPEGRVNETLFSRFVPEHQPMMENLIVREHVNITIEQGLGAMPYRLDAKFLLNRTLLGPYPSVWLWFPNNITCATARLYGDPCAVEPSVRDGQGGFYIKARPEYFREEPILEVNITGNLTDRWCDFFIVTVPVEDSTVRYILHPSFRETATSSPFERTKVNVTGGYRTVEFSGRCTGKGPVHVEWEKDASPATWLEASVASVNAGSAVIQWTTSNDPGFTAYEVYRSEQPGQPGTLAGRVTEATRTSFEVTGLRSNTTYYFSVRKLLAADTTVYSNLVELRTLAYPLSAPRMIVYYTGAAGDVPVLRWERCENPDFTLYELFRGISQGNKASVFNTSDPSVTQRILSGLDPWTTYYFQLKVRTVANGWVWSNEVEVSLPPRTPGRPNLAVVRNHNEPETARLVWNASGAAGFGCYEVYRSTEPGSPGSLVSRITDPYIVNWTSNGLDPSEDYYFTLRMVTDRGDFADSNQVEAAAPASGGGENAVVVDIPPVAAAALAVAAAVIVIGFLALGRARKPEK